LTPGCRCNAVVARIRSALSLFALVATLASTMWLARLEAGGPSRTELDLPGGIPATLYLPPAVDSDEDDGELGAPPAVVLAHGFASDRAGMSGLARALTQAGYAVLTLDFRGHGENRNAFTRSRSQEDSLFADLRTAVDFLRTSSDVDGARLSVMGHSMGAGASLGYASFDPALDATVMISGGWRLEGPHRPPNALFIYGEGDPERIREGSARLAAELGGSGEVAPGAVLGDFSEGTAVSHLEVARADHITILSSQYAARAIIDWLDDAYGVERGTLFLRADPRLRAAMLGLLSFALLLPGLGAAIGRLSPHFAERPAKGAPIRLLFLALALVATLPVVSVGGAERLLPLVLGNTVSLHLFAAGLLIAVAAALRGRFEPWTLRADWPQSLGSAALAVAIVFLLMTPFGVVLHGLGLTPERGLVAVFVLILVTPFQLVFHGLLRRGGTLLAAVASSLGRVLVLVVLVLAVSAGVVSGVVMLMLPVLALLFVLFEVLSSSIYAASRNYVVPALVEAGWLSWIFAAVLPISV
jgi:dienelactone hydrolase